MKELLYQTVKNLLQKMKDGSAVPQDYANAAKILHNNKITVEITEGETPEGMLDDLPFDNSDGKVVAIRQGI